MSEAKFKVDFGFMKVGFWLSVILAVLKFSNVLDIKTWLVFLPLMVSVAILFIFVLIIGVTTLFLIAKTIAEREDEDETDDEEEPEEE